jgi:hypothetical protein
MDPMSSGDVRPREHGAGAAAAGQSLGRARSGAEAAMGAAAAVGHGGLAAGTAATGVGAAAASGKEVAGRVAVLEPAAPFDREAGAEQCRIRAIDPMSGGR